MGCCESSCCPSFWTDASAQRVQGCYLWVVCLGIPFWCLWERSGGFKLLSNDLGCQSGVSFERPRGDETGPRGCPVLFRLQGS